MALNFKLEIIRLMMSGYRPFKGFVHGNMQAESFSTVRKCGIDKQTVKHFLFNCKTFSWTKKNWIETRSIVPTVKTNKQKIRRIQTHDKFRETLYLIFSNALFLRLRQYFWRAIGIAVESVVFQEEFRNTAFIKQSLWNNSNPKMFYGAISLLDYKLYNYFYHKTIKKFRVSAVFKWISNH